MLKPGLVRFLLSSIVIFYHLSGAVYIGNMAVYCFFMLSGYWVIYMYDNKYIKYENKLTTFYLSRIFRLFPVYLLMSLLIIIVSLIYQPDLFSLLKIQNKALFWLSNIFLIGYNQLSFKPVVPAWSLDIELQFYILLPLLFVISKTKINGILMLVIFGIISIIISVGFPGAAIAKTVVPYLTYFFIGTLIYKNKLRFTFRTELFFNCLLIFVLIAHYSLGITSYYTAVKTYPYYKSYFNQILSLLTIPLLCNCVYSKSDKLDRVLGEMSYVLYLTHWLFIIPYNHLITGFSKLQRIPISICYLLITYFVSYLIFKYYDKPVDKLRRNWLELQPVIADHKTNNTISK